jgi:hypothetical protein
MDKTINIQFIGVIHSALLVYEYHIDTLHNNVRFLLKTILQMKNGSWDSCQYRDEAKG